MAYFRADFPSEQLGMSTSVHLFIPDKQENRKLNVLYLLHGLSDNCANWVWQTSIGRYARKYNLAVVIPEVQRSFYTDMAYGINYFSYVTKELPQFVHNMFGLSLARENNYVAGLSMGGYGAMKCAFTFPKRYAGCAAFSSACDMQYNIDERIISTTELNEMKAIYGDELWVNPKNDVYALAKKMTKSAARPKIYLSCGTKDVLLPQSRKMRDLLAELDVEARYEEWEEDHTWDFWDASLQKALAYFFPEA